MAKKPLDDKSKRAKEWLDRIDAAIKREEPWRERGKDVIKRFRDQRERRAESTVSKVNILWSNTEVLRAALYARTAQPDVRRRFPDAADGDPLTRIAAEVIERSLSYCNDSYDVDAPVESALLDYLLPGRGTTWVCYEPEIVGEGEEASIGEQKLYDEYVYWKDFCHGKARTWQQVPWVARRHAMALGSFKKKFPDVEEEPELSHSLLDNDEHKDADGDEEGLVEVWEVWDKSTKQRIYVARGFKDVVQRDDDPLKLVNFFPTPRPLYSVMTTDGLIPEPEFCLYQDQADELDRVATRIKVLLEALKWKGIYDGSIDGENILSTLAAAGDNKFLAYPNWNVLKEKGGIENAVGFWPLDRIIMVLEQLYPRGSQLIQEIYEITGISDIIRGATDPNETLGAQELKSQFGSMRMQKRQREIQRYVRDIYRLKAEIIAEHFTQETLAAITNIQLPTAEEQAQAQAALDQMEAEQAPPMGHNGGPPMGVEGTPPLPPMGAGIPPPVPPAPVASAGMMMQGADGAMAAPMMNGGPVQVNGAAPPGMNGGIPPELMAGLNGGTPPGPAALSPPTQPAPAGVPPPPMPEAEMAPEEPPEELVKAATSPTWEDLIELLRSDKLRAYRIDVETDSTIFVDSEQEKQSRIEFMTAAQGLLTSSMEMIQIAPSTIPLVKEMFLFGVRSFKPGRTLEEAFEDAFDQLAKNPPQPPVEAGPSGPDPEIEKAKLDVQMQEIEKKYGIAEKTAMADARNKSDSLNVDVTDKKSKAELEIEKLRLHAKTEADKIAVDREKIELEREKIGLERERVQLESRKMDAEVEVKREETNIKRRSAEEDVAIKRQQVDDDHAFKQKDVAVKIAGQNKQILDERTAEASEVEEETIRDLSGLETLQKGVQTLAETIAQSQQQQAEIVAQGFAQQSKTLEELIKQNSMPKEVVRGPDNRIVGIKTVGA